MQLWPVLSRCLETFAVSRRTVEHTITSLRFAVRSLGVHSFDFLPALVHQMVAIYARNPHSSLLYLGSVLVDEYGAFGEVGPGLLAMTEVLSSLFRHNPVVSPISTASPFARP